MSLECGRNPSPHYRNYIFITSFMKSIYVRLISSLFLLIPFLANASEYKVKAAVVDSIGQPELYVTWRIFSADTTLTTQIAGSVTDDSGIIYTDLSNAGEYKLSLQGMTGGTLDVEFSFSDLAPIDDLGFITLTS